VAWLDQQRRFTDSFLARASGRQALRARITELTDYPRASAPFERGARWFQTRNTGLQDQSVLYVSDLPAGEGRVLIDPNRLSEDGTVALTHLSVSPDGSLAAYAVSEAGSDWLNWRVRDTATGEDLPGVVRWSKFCVAAWRHDLSGFYYSGLQPPSGHSWPRARGSPRGVTPGGTQVRNVALPVIRRSYQAFCLDHRPGRRYAGEDRERLALFPTDRVAARHQAKRRPGGSGPARPDGRRR